MKKVITLFTFLLPLIFMAQSTNKNYVKSTSYIEEHDLSTVKNNPSSISEDDKTETVAYFDGLGRPMQSVAQRMGGNKEDIITFIDYDSYGRQTHNYLPFAETTNGGLFRSLALNSTNSFYNTTKYENTLNPYSQKVIENSPLSRVFEQAAPGNDWNLNNDKTIKFDYKLNSANEVKYYKVEFQNDDSEKPYIINDGSFYTAKTLYKSIVKDENWTVASGLNHTTEEFKDKLDRVLLKRTYADMDINNDGVINPGESQIPHDTYYVYDDFGNLTFVIPPLAADSTITAASAIPTVFTHTFSAGEFIEDSSGNDSGSGNVIVGVALNTTTGNYEYSIDFNLVFSSGDKLKLDEPVTLPNSSGLLDASIFDIYRIVLGVLYLDHYNFSIVNGQIVVSLIDGVPFNVRRIGDLNTFIIASSLEYDTSNQNTLDDLCYQYRYDKRNRLIEKKIPGKGWEHIIYNNLDQPIMTQDAKQRLSNEWLFTMYDIFGRVAYTGIVNNNSSRTSIQQTVNGLSTTHTSKNPLPLSAPDGTTIYYTGGYPTSISEIYTINYYDDYTFMGSETGITIPTTNAYAETINSNNATSLSTGSKVRVLTTSDWITSLSYYDDKGQVNYALNKNEYLEATDILESKYKFSGIIEETTSTHSKIGSPNIVTVDNFEYDHVNRLISNDQTINSLVTKKETIVENTYDELGQLSQKGVGGNYALNRLQTIDYTYNVRGWLKNLNNDSHNDNDLFNLTLRYNDPTTGNALYNGNISQTSWNTLNTDSSVKTYTYQYDALNRITDGTDNTNRYDLSGINYDKNGNILTLKREGHIVYNPNSGTPSDFGTMDDLAYEYNGNQLLKVDELISGNSTYGFKNGTNTNNDYDYDVNGNMKKDENKGISTIQYNHLNLPTSINFSSSPGGTISYVYDATGNKLMKSATTVGTGVKNTYYAGNYIYSNSTTFIFGGSTSTPIELEFFNQLEGYVEPDGSSGYQYVYQYKDHLGNVRLSYADANYNNSINASTEIKEENNYYPFGLKHKGYNGAVIGTDHKFEYNGAEMEESLGLNLMEMDLRQYDPAIARWTAIDPVTHYSNSTYNAFDNNPIFWADPSGADAVGIRDNNGNNLGHWSDEEGESNSSGTSSGTSSGDNPSSENVDSSNTSTSSSSNSQEQESCSNCPDKDRKNLAIMMANRYPGTTPQEFYDYLTNPESVLSSNISKNLEDLAMFSIIKTGTGGKGTGKSWLKRQIGKYLVGIRGKIIKNIENVMANPHLLKGQSLEKVQGLLANKTGWVNDVMRKSTTNPSGGWVLREMNKAGTDFTGRLIQYHPGTTRHFNGAPYWKVSNGTTTVRKLAGTMAKQ